MGAAAQAAEAARSTQVHASDSSRGRLQLAVANFGRKPDPIFQCSPRSTLDSKVAEHVRRAYAVTHGVFQRGLCEAYNNVVPSGYAARAIAT